MSLVFQTLSQRYSEKLFFVLLEAESVPSISGKYDVSVVPTFIGLREGVAVWKLEGANPPELGKLVKKFAENPAEFAPLIPTTQAQPTPTPPAPFYTDDKLRELASSAPVMLFMKGSPSSAKCGFSRKTVEILQKHDIPFSSFDILQNEEVRSGLKKLFDWPTYPQLYINGQLIGGFDILTEMATSAVEGDGGAGLKRELGIEHLSAKSSQPTTQVVDEPSESTEGLLNRIRQLINRSPVMIFMKGTPDEPKCGFSRKTVELFRLEEIAFDSYNILQDDALREGLKKYSDWPTYPQVYYRGALVGGLDILKQMKEENGGSLKEHFL